MVKTDELLELIKKSGKSKSFLADKLDISRPYFYRKLNGEVDLLQVRLISCVTNWGSQSYPTKNAYFFSLIVEK